MQEKIRCLCACLGVKLYEQDWRDNTNGGQTHGSWKFLARINQ